MKFSLAKDVLLDGLMLVSSAAASRSAMPVLTNVMIKAQGDHIELIATDTEIGIKTSIPAIIEQEGAITLPAKKLLSIVQQFPGAEVSVDVDERSVAKIVCSRSTVKLFGLPASEFPTFPSVGQADSKYILNQVALKEGIHSTDYAVSTDEGGNNYMLTGMLLMMEPDGMTLVGTDGRRLSMAKRDVVSEVTETRQMIVPRRAIQELYRLLGDTGDMTIYVQGNHAFFELGETMMTTKLVEGQYPNFRQVIPKNTREHIELPCDEILKIVRRVSLLASEKSAIIDFYFTENELRLHCSNQEVGEASETFPIEYHGPELSLSFNPDYMMAPLKSVGSDSISFDFTDAMTPCVIRVGDEFTYVIMPMRTGR